MTTEINDPSNKIWSVEVIKLATGEWFMYNSILHRVIGFDKFTGAGRERIYVNMKTGESILISPSNKVLQADATIDAKYKMK